MDSARPSALPNAGIILACGMACAFVSMFVACGRHDGELATESPIVSAAAGNRIGSKVFVSEETKPASAAAYVLGGDGELRGVEVALWESGLVLAGKQHDDGQFDYVAGRCSKEEVTDLLGKLAQMPAKAGLSTFHYSTFDMPHDLLYVEASGVQWQMVSFHRYWADADYWASQKGFNEFSACWNAVEQELTAIGMRCPPPHLSKARYQCLLRLENDVERGSGACTNALLTGGRVAENGSFVLTQVEAGCGGLALWAARLPTPLTRSPEGAGQTA